MIGAMMIIRKGLAALLVLLGLGTSAFEAKADVLEPTELHLVMWMGGVTAGTMRLSIDPGDGEVESSLRMKSQGLFKLLTGYKSRAKARTKPAVNGTAPMPMTFDSTYETKKTEREVMIRYDPENGEITGLENYKRGEPRKNKVPEELRLDTVDPLTAVLQLRHWIREIRAGEGVVPVSVEAGGGLARKFEIFDGRRRYRLDAEFLGRREIKVDGPNLSGLRFKVRMEPLAGFSSKDMLANWSSEDGQRWIELIVTDDDNPIPYSMITKGGTLETTILLRKACIGNRKCRKFES